VSAEEVTLGLDEIGRESLGAVAVEERKLYANQHECVVMKDEGTHGSGECRDGDTPEGGLSNDAPPSGLGFGDGLEEEGAGEEVLEAGVLTVGRSDVRKEDGLLGLVINFMPIRFYSP
jgi:hypothetical protein